MKKKRLRPSPLSSSSSLSMVSVDLAMLLDIFFGGALLLAQSRRGG